MLERIEHIERDDEGRIKQRIHLQNGLLDGPLTLYDEQQMVTQVIHYRAGEVDGAMLTLGELGEPLFALPTLWQPILEDENLAPPSTTIAEPRGKDSSYQSSPYQFSPTFAAFSAIQSPPPEPTKPSHPLAPLQPLFQEQGYPLGVDAVAMEIESQAEWFITDKVRAYTVRREGSQLTVFLGRVIESAQFKLGQQQGETRLYAKGWIIQIIPFCQDKLHGALIHYAGGKKRTVVHYEHGVQEGPMITYDDQEREIIVAPYKEGQLHGLLMIYNNQGKQQSLIHYEAGKEAGQSTIYHANGKESQVASYRSGVLDGSFQLFYESGQMMRQTHYEAGKLTGQTIEYFPNGKTREVAHYQADQLHGEVSTYNEKGKLIAKKYFEQGQELPAPTDPTKAANRPIETDRQPSQSKQRPKWFFGRGQDR